MKNIFFILIGLSVLACRSQEKIIMDTSYCDEGIFIDYRTMKYFDTEDNIADDIGEKKITVIMESGFSDTLKIYFNGKLKLKSFFSTKSRWVEEIPKSRHGVEYDYSKDSWPLSELSEQFDTLLIGVEYDYSKDSCPPLLRVESVTSGYCLELQIDPRYRILYLYRTGKRWRGNYSNFYHDYDE